tara:strand:+ start:7460 stop:10432 length:2973 start_codon:yes stop_codon:yes gene_type:complete
MSKVKTLIATSVLLVASLSFSQAEEISYPGFSGNVNTTVTTGLQVRVDENCLGQTGFINVAGDSTYIAAVNANRSSDAAVLLQDHEPGCGKIYQDGYGNPVDPKGSRQELISNNADDGRMNFREGDIFNSTTRVFTEINGTMDNGTGLTASFVGSYNPITSFTNPTWAPFTSDALDDIETNVDVLDLYLTADVAELDATVNFGRYVTNWGESTFIPVGMNGLTTNAIDLAKLRTPGASIREALVPANQVSLSGYLDGGVSYEAYYQFGETHVEFDPNGTFFGNEVVSGDRLMFTSGYYQNSQSQSGACSYLNTVARGEACDADTIAFAAANPANSGMYYFQEGFKGMFGGAKVANLVGKSGALAYGAAAAAAIGGSNGDMPSLAMAGLASGVVAGYAGWNEYDNKLGRKGGTLDSFGGTHVYADGDEQYGIALRSYLPDVGSGVDIGFYFTQYDSKVPYLRFIGDGGIHAGDLLGAFTYAATCAAVGNACDDGGAFASGEYNSDHVGDGSGVMAALDGAEAVGMGQIATGIVNLAYSEAGCGAYMNPQAVDELYNSGAAGAAASNFSWTSAQKSNALTYYNYTVVNGGLYHDSARCADNAKSSGSVSGNDFGTAATQLAAGAILGAAVTPLNLAKYEFIYPENLNAMGFSANTNINGTTVQAEITYRPDFPLATNGGDQGQQISDAAGTTTLLSIAVAQGVRGKCALAGGSATAATLASQSASIQTTCGAQSAAVAAYRAGTGDSDAEWADVVGAMKNMKRSSLPAISLATVGAGDYYSTPYIEHDVWSGTLGTTTTFTASHPITTGLGADGSFLLTEIGFVHVTGLDYTKGGINRGGFRDGVGGAKCGGVTNGGGAPTTYNSVRALDGATHIGSSQTDPLFGNGSYCESKNTIDDTSITYRLVGGATYNNVGNTPWTFAPSFVWSHDISGYGPTSLGGFVPGRQSLSLSGNLTKGDMKVGLSYVNQMGDEMDNLDFDKDYLSASVSYAF